MTYNALVTAPRRTLADLNASFRSSSETSDFVLTTEYRVGRYGLRVSRDGYGSRGVGGKLRHLVGVTVITEIKADYNWQPYCAEMVSGYRGTPEQRQERRERQVANHGTYSHHCRQPKVGDIVYARQQCVDQNAVGKGAYEPSDADTDAIGCSNCLVRIFGETVEPRAKVEAALESRPARRRQGQESAADVLPLWRRSPADQGHRGRRDPPLRPLQRALRDDLLGRDDGRLLPVPRRVPTLGIRPHRHQGCWRWALAEETREYDELLRREGGTHDDAAAPQPCASPMGSARGRPQDVPGRPSHASAASSPSANRSDTEHKENP